MASPSAVVQIEATGCLAQCDVGPNVQVQNNDKVYHGVASPLHAVALLQGAADGALTFAPTLINAVMALEKAQAGEWCWGCIWHS